MNNKRKRICVYAISLRNRRRPDRRRSRPLPSVKRLCGLPPSVPALPPASPAYSWPRGTPRGPLKPFFGAPAQHRTTRWHHGIDEPTAPEVLFAHQRAAAPLQHARPATAASDRLVDALPAAPTSQLASVLVLLRRRRLAAPSRLARPPRCLLLGSDAFFFCLPLE